MSAASVFFPSKIVEQTFTTSTTFVVPNRVELLNLLGVGAGAGGASNTDLTQGAAAGDIENIFVPVTPGETITITIGQGGVGVSGPPTGNDGGDTIVQTAEKTYYFFGGKANSYDATGNSGARKRYASNGTNVTTPSNSPGGEAGYEDGGDAGTTFVDGQDGGIGAGGGSTSDGGQTGGDGGNGLVKIWYHPID